MTSARVWNRVRMVAGAAAAAVLGVAPHALHHASPLAGAAIFAGAAGTAIFGALGLLAAVPMLMRIRRRSGSWRRPVAMLALFAALFVLSTTVVGPGIIGDPGGNEPGPSEPANHEEHQR